MENRYLAHLSNNSGARGFLLSAKEGSDFWPIEGGTACPELSDPGNSAFAADCREISPCHGDVWSSRGPLAREFHVREKRPGKRVVRGRLKMAGPSTPPRLSSVVRQQIGAGR
ncbi:hypothetical protein K0M31_013554 [Melipona bicolor]|uniref:Uncharacterized protein n=1 Tax=Melipona bicolor TaxID=60889 RepID=A0AA40FHM3_9HYME|nr:hypothetical protein K0M31_013554 [Melipona bicolor]